MGKHEKQAVIMPVLQGQSCYYSDFNLRIQFMDFIDKVGYIMIIRSRECLNHVKRVYGL